MSDYLDGADAFNCVLDRLIESEKDRSKGSGEVFILQSELEKVRRELERAAKENHSLRDQLAHFESGAVHKLLTQIKEDWTREQPSLAETMNEIDRLLPLIEPIPF